MDQIGPWIRELRGTRTAREVAAAGGPGVTELSAIEHGKRHPTLAKLRQIATGLGVTLAYLVDPENAARRVPQDEQERDQ